MKSRINILIATLTVVLLGLVVVQVFWIRNAVQLRTESFDHHVNEALAKVAERLERLEAVTKVRTHKEAKFLFYGDTSLTDFDPNQIDSALHYVVRDIHKGDQGQIVFDERGGSDGEQYSKKIETTTASEDSLLERELLGQGVKLQVAPRAKERSPEENELMTQRVSKKQAFVGDIVKSLMEVNLQETIEDRVDRELLAKLLDEEFSMREIDARYQFAIYDGEENLRIGEVKTDDDNIRNSPWKTVLFPNDIYRGENLLKVYFPHRRRFLLGQLWLALLTSAGLMLSVVFIFYYTISTIIQQKKISDIKTDFVNNMTHELKTPISTISLACEALNDPSFEAEVVLRQKYVKMIREENVRLQNMVEQVLQSAIWDRAEFKIKEETFDFNDVIVDMARNMEIVINEKQGTLKVDQKASHTWVHGDKVHLTNVLFNLMDNAVKYSKNQAKISVSTCNKRNYLVVEVTDNGIGISKENQKRVFDKLYRVPTGNVHDVKGFGLGLNYVQTVVERHNGQVKVKSELGKGSTFSIYIPYLARNEQNESIIS